MELRAYSYRGHCEARGAYQWVRPHSGAIRPMWANRIKGWACHGTVLGDNLEFNTFTE